MNRKLISFLILIIVLMKMSQVTFNVQKVKASGSIEIRADGLVDPPGTPILNVSNVTYTFASDISGSIVVRRSNIVIDGNGHALEGLGYDKGFYLNGTRNVTIKNTKIQDFKDNGINFYRTSNNTICRNTITTNGDGICLDYSLNTTIVGNVITANKYNGINLRWSPDNTISGNNITSNYYGLRFDEAHRNMIIGNVVTKNKMYGIHLYMSYDNTIAENLIETSTDHGIYLLRSLGNTLAENIIIKNKDDGIHLHMSFNNTIIRNNIDTNGDGISLSASSNNTISGNTLFLNNYDGLYLYDSFSNSIHHNNFIDNSHQWRSIVSANVWDNGFEGNYWSNYAGIDLNQDGIGDTPYIMDENNADHYPLIGRFHSFNTSLGYYVNVISNSTIEDFQYFKSNSTIRMHVSNITAAQTFGFCKVCIPKGLMPPPYVVIIDEGLTEVLHLNETIYDNGTHIWIYFAYEHSTHKVAIIHEHTQYDNYYLLFMTTTFSIIATLLAVIFYRRKLAKAKQQVLK